MSFTMETPLINKEIPPSVEKEINGKEGFNCSSVKIEYNQAVQIASILQICNEKSFDVQNHDILSIMRENV